MQRERNQEPGRGGSHTGELRRGDGWFGVADLTRKKARGERQEGSRVSGRLGGVVVDLVGAEVHRMATTWPSAPWTGALYPRGWGEQRKRNEQGLGGPAWQLRPFGPSGPGGFYLLFYSILFYLFFSVLF